MNKFKCPFCKEEIAPYSKTCPNCKESLKDYINCKECGEFIPKESKECPECSTKQVNKTKRNIITIIVVAILIIGMVFVYNAIKKAEYQDNYNQVIIKMADNLGDIEAFLINKNNVWVNSIYKQSDTYTDKYTKDDNGWFYEDFDVAIDNLFEDSQVKTKLLSIDETHNEIELLIKELNNVPSGFENAYNALINMYSDYCDFYQLIYSGNSLNSFNDKYRTLEGSILSDLNIVKTYMK